MSVWFCIPSARPAAEAEPVFEQWQRMGYRVAVLRQGEAVKHTDIQISTPTYKGWARSINKLVKTILKHDEDVDWVVSGGDDTLPDPDHTEEEIAAQCEDYFEEPGGVKDGTRSWINATFGVMQPTGDRWGVGEHAPDRTSAYIDRVAGSPWLGREFCRRMYGGKGPMFEGYKHMFADEELQAVATKLGVFWQRPDLTQRHNHWARPRGNRADMPGFAADINSPQHWQESKALFEQRKAAGWPGSEPIL